MPRRNVPPTRRELSDKQQRAASLLTRYLKDAHTNLHGPTSWTTDDDEAVKQIVEDLTDPTELAKSVTRRLYKHASRF